MAQSCLNCDHELSSNFCSNCGQKNISPGISFKSVIADFFSYSFSIDGPVGQTLKLLVVNPGQLFRDFIGGKRKSYYRPIQFFLIASVVYFAFSEMVGYDPLEGEFQQPAPERMKPILQKVELTTRFMVQNINNLIFILVFSIGAVLKVFYRKRQRFAEFLAIGFYIAAFYILVGIVDPFMWLFGVDLKNFRLLFFFVYFAYAWSSYLGGFSAKNIIVSTLIGLLSFVLYFLLSFGLSWVLV